MIFPKSARQIRLRLEAKQTRRKAKRELAEKVKKWEQGLSGFNDPHSSTQAQGNDTLSNQPIATVSELAAHRRKQKGVN